MSQQIDIIFQPSEGTPDLVFVEVQEVMSYQSISIGEWIDLSDGTRALRLTIDDA